MLVSDDFDRRLYCIIGLPVDAESVQSTIDKLNAATFHKSRVFLTTPNLNFAIAALRDSEFRSTVIKSNLIVVDGMPLVLIAKLLKIPLPERVAGATLFELMSNGVPSLAKIKVFFFGGLDGVAKKAHEAINSSSKGVESVGYLYPGFKSTSEMSNQAYIEAINRASPDFLVVSLGAKKGQFWIDRNLEKLDAPVISHLGAVVNFTAGTLLRAPKRVQDMGFEWLWRIKEEPSLWKRYLNDGLAFLYLLFLRVLPLAVITRVAFACLMSGRGDIQVQRVGDACIKLNLSGHFLSSLHSEHRQVLRETLSRKVDVVIDCKNAGFLGTSFFAFMLLFKQKVKAHDNQLSFVNLSFFKRLLFKLNCVEFLIK